MKRDVPIMAFMVNTWTVVKTVYTIEIVLIWALLFGLCSYNTILYKQS